MTWSSGRLKIREVLYKEPIINDEERARERLDKSKKERTKKKGMGEGRGEKRGKGKRGITVVHGGEYLNDFLILGLRSG